MFVLYKVLIKRVEHVNAMVYPALDHSIISKSNIAQINIL